MSIAADYPARATDLRSVARQITRLGTSTTVSCLAEPYDVGVGAGRELVNDTVAAATCLIGAILTVLRHQRTASAVTSGP